ncbi:Rne/Rng family ribonuclease [Aestuariimicrobium ganziense]|uniref:Rne/Rng family ribonuclease n=1 Tax=Aestuariimicrobium ganziense TaxID=2773677 RepID=UPI0019443B07|nr:Rne/Rng family ribonuclease [Aestuariimicrobium ganziense]
MLSDDIVESSTSGSESTSQTADQSNPDQPTAKAPRGRRAVSRPAGPPAPVSPPPAPEVTQAAPAPAEPAPVEQALQPVAESPTEAAAEQAPKRATRRRATRGQAAPTPGEAPAVEPAQPVPAQAEPAQAEPAQAEPTQTEPAQAEPAADEKPKRTRSRRSTAKAKAEQVASEQTAPEESSTQGADEVQTLLAAAEAEAATRPARRRRVASSVANPFQPPAEVNTDDVLQSLAASIAGVAPEQPEAALDEEEAEQVDSEDEVETDEADTDDQAEDSAEEQDTSDSEDDDSADDDSDDSEDGDSDDSGSSGSSRRRRRRRGGRRRRRGGSGDSDDSESSTDSESSDDSDSEDSSDDADDSDGDDSDDADGSDSGTSSRRRRRRRRRRGEDTSGAEDDPSEVVVRVREPRRSSRSSSSDEVTGIEGSTRMEAKRQRRREGRAAGRRRSPILSESEFLARRESVERRMVIRQKDDYTQLAVLEDGILVEHYVDRKASASMIGNVYLGRVQNVLPSMEAAFIDIGRGRNAVLYAGEVDWDAFGVTGEQRKVEQVLKSGQTVLVQVSKDPVGAKGARLTSHVAIPGRYVVYSPGGHLSGISRKLADTERNRLKDILGGLIDEKASVIVRTAAEGASEDELVRDVNRLKAQWEVIEKKVKQGSAPQLLYGEPDLTVRIVRDLFTEDFTELVVQGNGGPEDVHDAIKGYVDHVAPHLAERLKRWDDSSGDIFASHKLDEQIAKALERKVFLPSGGSLVIDRTEAMTVIDVNTGRFTGTAGNLEATVTSNNLEAAEEVVRQLRLRDIGGIIVVDFIDMVLPSNRELLIRRLVECLGRDRTRHQVAEVSSLGLVQMTRKKIGTGLAEAFTETCEHCGGRGYHRSEEPVESQAPSDGGDRRSGGGRGGNGSSRSSSGSSRSSNGGGSGSSRSRRGRRGDSSGNGQGGDNGSDGNGSSNHATQAGQDD